MKICICTNGFRLIRWYRMKIPFTETCCITAKSAEQDQTAHMCSLILLHTLCNINSRSRTAENGINIGIHDPELCFLGKDVIK